MTLRHCIYTMGLLLAITSFACGSPNRATKPAAGELQVQQTYVLPKDWGMTYSATMRSTNLGQERKVNIYLPLSFAKTTRSYPVIFLTDGEYYFQRAVTAERQLASVGHIPECIVVGIETPDRRQDLTPPGMAEITSDGPDQRGEKMMRFIAQELKPQLATKFRGGSPTVLMGHSHGGILCAYAAAKWRKDIPFIVSLDGPMHLDNGWLNNELIKSATGKKNLRVVSMEVKFGWTDDAWTKLSAAAPKEWKLSRIKLQGEDHESMVFNSFYQGLKTLFSDYSQVQVKNMSGPEAFGHYQALEPLYGALPTPPQFVLRRAVMDYAFFGKAAPARQALKVWSDSYGKPDDYTELTSLISEGEQAMKGKPTLEEVLATTPPTAAEMAPFVGVWKGFSWVSLDPEHKSSITVTFAVENGRGVGKIVHEDAPPEYREAKIIYMKSVSGGLEFGNLNGMTPRGVNVNVGKLIGNRLEGEMIMKGAFMKATAEEKGLKFLFTLVKTKN